MLLFFYFQNVGIFKNLTEYGVLGFVCIALGASIFLSVRWLGRNLPKMLSLISEPYLRTLVKQGETLEKLADSVLKMVEITSSTNANVLVLNEKMETQRDAISRLELLFQQKDELQKEFIEEAKKEAAYDRGELKELARLIKERMDSQYSILQMMNNKIQ